MPLRWAPGLLRTQLIRRAARILAYHNAIEASQPHDWNLHVLAAGLMAELHRQGIPTNAANVEVRQTTNRHLDLGTQQWTGTSQEITTATAHATPAGACLHAGQKCEGYNLLDDSRFWTNRISHGLLARFLRLDGRACSEHPYGPWAKHERRVAAPLRAAFVGLIYQRAHNQHAMLNPPGGLHTGNMWMIGKTVQEAYIDPFHNRFYQTLASTNTADDQGRATPWFDGADEKHWSIELAAAIATTASHVRLDCPPLVIPLEIIEKRGTQSISQALLHHLVLDATGPRMRAATAAARLGMTPHAAHEQLSRLRRNQTRSAP